nr:hypothetical protein [Clostridia bacterium]
MDEQLRDPREELSYIRSILEKTADGLKAAAPWFIRFGILWLVYGILHTAQRILSPALSLSVVQAIAHVFSIISWLFYISLAVGFFTERRRLTEQGCNALCLKLIDIWGLCILAFLFLTVVLTVILSVLAARFFSFSDELTNRFYTTLTICRTFLIFILPLLPLLITAIILDNRRMLWTGIVLSAMAAVILSIHVFLVLGSGFTEIPVTNAMVTAYTFVICLLDIAPGLMLLYFGYALKRG